MWLSHFWLLLGWTIYGVLHSILASRDCKNIVSRKFAGIFRYYRLFYIMIASITLLPLLWLLYITPSFLLWEPVLISRVGGAIGVTIGTIIMALSLRVYSSTVLRVRDLVAENADSVLFQKGLHAYVRHPLYLGTFFMLWGIFLIIPLVSLLVTNIIITTYTLLGIRFEERKLKAAFGEIYMRYMKEVPMIWPGSGKSKR